MRIFADEYLSTFYALLNSAVDITARNGAVTHELCGHYIQCSVDAGISIFSHEDHRVFPMKFALAELAWILSGRDDLASIQPYCAAMTHFSDDNMTLTGAYGVRLREQWERAVEMLRADPSSRRVVLPIYRETDLCRKTNDIPCNIALQVLIRRCHVLLSVTSRSSDFITGYPIDMFHWQVLAHMLAREFACNTAQTVSYAVGSLHLYGIDHSVVSDWHRDPIGYAHMMSIEKPLLTAIRDCQRSFSTHLSVEDLCDLLGVTQIDTCTMLHDIFRRRRSRVSR